MLTLYHSYGAVCAAKVRLVLAEKNLPYESRVIDNLKGEQFSPEYLKLNPNAVVPTLVHDGKVIIESTVINEYIDEVFPDVPLRPADPFGRAQVHLWTKREDTIHNAVNTMTTVTFFRAQLLEKTPEERRARYEKMPDPIRREKWQRMIDEGVGSSLVVEALTQFLRQFRDMESTLTTGKWLVGDRFTLADAGLVSFLYRLEMLQMAGLWRDRFPALADWLERCKARPSFDEAIARHFSKEAHERFRSVVAPLWPQVNEVANRVMTTL